MRHQQHETRVHVCQAVGDPVGTGNTAAPCASGHRNGWALTISIVTTLELQMRSSRASDADREQAVDVLRANAVGGRLSHDTFMRRLDLAFTARRRGELDDLVTDLPASGRVSQSLINAVGRLAEFRRLVRAAWRAPQISGLRLPPDAPYPLRIGRGPGCELYLGDASVSRVHAELLNLGGDWTLRDLRSTNGTTVNGWRITTEAVVRPGDVVKFGNVRFRLHR